MSDYPAHTKIWGPIHDPISEDSIPDDALASWKTVKPFVIVEGDHTLDSTR
jgi:hypothetical protein